VAGAIGLAAVLAIALPVLALMSGGDEDEEEPPVPTASDAPRSQGAPEAIPPAPSPSPASAQASGGATTAYALGSSLADAGEYVAALAHYRTAVQIRPAYVSDPKLCRDVVQALGDRRAQAAAKGLVQDVLRQHATEPLAEAAASSRRLLRRNARALLEGLVDEPEWPTWLRDSQALRAAPSCPAKRAIVQRLRQAGDPRALPALLELRDQRGGCGFLGLSDCMSCLRPDLAATISELQSHDSGG
jgi:hypothetical protein